MLAMVPCLLFSLPSGLNIIEVVLTTVFAIAMFLLFPNKLGNTCFLNPPDGERNDASRTNLYLFELRNVSAVTSGNVCKKFSCNLGKSP